MKKIYKHIRFEKKRKRGVVQEHCDKPIWHCLNNGTDEIIGMIFYHSEWKKYVFTQFKENVIFDSVCLNNIVKFLNQLDNGD